MNPHRPLTRRSFLSGAAAIGGAAAFGSPLSAFAAVNEAKLTIGTFLSDTGMQALFAQDDGIFKKHGLSSDIRVMASGTAIVPGVVSGSLDIGISNVGSLGAAYARSLPVVILAPGALYNSKKPTTALMVRGQSPIKTAKDLEGKTVAVNGLKDLVMFSTKAWIDQNGGDSDKVKFVEISFPEMPNAVERGTVDAATMAEPAFSIAKSPAFGMRVLGYPYDAVNAKNPFLITAWFTTRDWIKKNPAPARRFVEAIGETTQWANHNPAQSARIMEKYVKIPPDVLTSMTRAEFAGTLMTGEIQPVLDIAYKSKLFPTAVAAPAIMARV